MRISELIEELQKLDPNAVVMIEMHNGHEWRSLTRIDIPFGDSHFRGMKPKPSAVTLLGFGLTKAQQLTALDATKSLGHEEMLRHFDLIRTAMLDASYQAANDMLDIWRRSAESARLDGYSRPGYRAELVPNPEAIAWAEDESRKLGRLPEGKE